MEIYACSFRYVCVYVGVCICACVPQGTCEPGQRYIFLSQLKITMPKQTTRQIEILSVRWVHVRVRLCAIVSTRTDLVCLLSWQNRIKRQQSRQMCINVLFVHPVCVCVVRVVCMCVFVSCVCVCSCACVCLCVPELSFPPLFWVFVNVCVRVCLCV